jgi:hypothetical protein
VVGGAVGEWLILTMGLRLDANVVWFFSVASSGLSSGSEHGGRQMLGSDSRVLLDPKHEENEKVGQRTLDDKDYDGVNSAVDSGKCT